jgi:CheY-like chemotaxis protein
MSTTSSGKTILVVEDDPITRDGFSTALREHGYAVALAANGQEALDYLRNHPAPDLILLAMLTQGMDGWQFLKARDARFASIPVLITTALGIASDLWAVSLGAVGVLHKPSTCVSWSERSRSAWRQTKRRGRDK